MGRIARTVGEDHAVRFESEDFVGRRIEPHSDDVRVSLGLPDDVPLDPTIYDDDGPFAKARVTPARATADLADQVPRLRVRGGTDRARDGPRALPTGHRGSLPARTVSHI